METRMTIEEQKLIEALRDAALTVDSERPQGALTTGELAEILNWSDTRVRHKLGQLKREGLIERVSVFMVDLADRNIPLPAYRLIGGQSPSLGGQSPSLGGQSPSSGGETLKQQDGKDSPLDER